MAARPCDGARSAPSTRPAAVTQRWSVTREWVGFLLLRCCGGVLGRLPFDDDESLIISATVPRMSNHRTGHSRDGGRSANLQPPDRPQPGRRTFFESRTAGPDTSGPADVRKLNFVENGSKFGRTTIRRRSLPMSSISHSRSKRHRCGCERGYLRVLGRVVSTGMKVQGCTAMVADGGQGGVVVHGPEVSFAWFYKVSATKTGL